MGQVVKATTLAIALAGGIHQGQAQRSLFREKALLQGDGDFLGQTNADKAASGQVGVIRDARHSGGGAYDLAHSGYSKAKRAKSFVGAGHARDRGSGMELGVPPAPTGGVA